MSGQRRTKAAWCEWDAAMIDYDFAVAGAGPAGSVFALLAARAGYRVLLAERHFEKPRFGETAPPELRAALTRIGLDHLTHAPYGRDAPELVSVWGGDQPVSRNHIVSPYGAALHLDRQKFDEALTFAARDAGADLRLGCGARFAQQPDGSHIVQLRGGATARANIAILATGRSGGNAGLPYTRCYLDDQVGVAAHFNLPGGVFGPCMLVEAVPSGWLYLSGLPSGSAVAILVTSAPLVPRGRNPRLRWWLETLARTKLIRAALRGCPIPKMLSVCDARGSYALRGGGENWLAIGDARIAPDPLSGQGSHWAIDDACTAIEFAKNSPWRNVADKMRASTAREVEQYRADRMLAYSRERRFESGLYWTMQTHPDRADEHPTTVANRERAAQRGR
jgi:flavin-dependent dehydrogenase